MVPRLVPYLSSIIMKPRLPPRVDRGLVAFFRENGSTGARALHFAASDELKFIGHEPSNEGKKWA